MQTRGSRGALSGSCRRRCRSRTSTRCRPYWPAPTSMATPMPRRWRGSARSCPRWPETDMSIASDIPTDPPPGRALFIGARLFVAADAFFFLGFLFAYLYLRALDSNGLWHPPHTNPSGALAGVSLVAVVAAAGIVRVADDRRAQGAAATAAVPERGAAVCGGLPQLQPRLSPPPIGRGCAGSPRVS